MAGWSQIQSHCWQRVSYLYQFHTNTAKHYFCKLCGIYPFHKPRVAPDFYGINVACLEDVDTFKLEPGLVDGRSYE